MFSITANQIFACIFCLVLDVIYNLVAVRQPVFIRYLLNNVLVSPPPQVSCWRDGLWKGYFVVGNWSASQVFRHKIKPVRGKRKASSTGALKKVSGGKVCVLPQTAVRILASWPSVATMEDILGECSFCGQLWQSPSKPALYINYSPSWVFF